LQNWAHKVALIAQPPWYSYIKGYGWRGTENANNALTAPMCGARCNNLKCN
jgi:hypothetical protein